jgi:phage gpG-like protein
MDINKLQAKFNELLPKILTKVEKIVLIYTMKAFKTASWDGKAWEKRKASSQTKSDRRQKDKPRALLIKSGNLRRSVIVFSKGNEITILSDMPYSEIQNQGGTINHPGGTPYTFGKDGKAKFIGRKKADELEAKAERKSKNSQITNSRRFRVTKPHKIEIPMRQFIGESNELNNQIEEVIAKEIEQIFITEWLKTI